MLKQVTLRKYIEESYAPFYEKKAKRLSNLKKDLWMINVIYQYDIAQKYLPEINKNDVLLFINELVKERGISRATVNRYRTRLNAIFNYAVENDDVRHNPVAALKKYKEYPRTRFLTKEEAMKLLDACFQSRNKELYAIVVLALNTGMREGEILNLSSRNFMEGHIFLYGDQTKSGLPRRIPLNETARRVLDECVNRERIHKIFKTKDIRSAFSYAKKRAGIEGLRFHDLRRTFATHLKDGMIDIHTISKLLGHSSVVTTERYLGTSDQKLLDSVNILEFS